MNSTSCNVFTLWSGAISRRSVKQSSIANSAMEVGTITVVGIAIEAVWLSNFLMDKGMAPSVQSTNTVVIAKWLQIRRNLVTIK